MIKAVIFDIDGVIVNGIKFSEQLKKDYGLSIEDTRPFFAGKFQDCLIGKADLKEELIPHLKSWGWQKGVDKFLDYWFKAEHYLDQDLLDYTNSLRKKGIKVCIATNQEKYRTQYLIEKMGFRENFDEIFSSTEVGYKKPEPEFFRFIISTLKLSPNEILFWDNTKNHIEGAKSVGIQARIYNNFKEFRKIMTNYLNN
jgi:putative hydrolase of the HAD superfamily